VEERRSLVVVRSLVAVGIAPGLVLHNRVAEVDSHGSADRMRLVEGKLEKEVDYIHLRVAGSSVADTVLMEELHNLVAEDKKNSSVAPDKGPGEADCSLAEVNL